MAKPAITVHELSKQYRLGELGMRYSTIRDQLTSGLRDVFRRRGGAETLWALDGVSFDVAEGEVVGVIGHNGAGKTTLLKILSRITRPTSGYAEFRGSLSSLLEVGTGFHPELTGRENIYLNGAILGMRKSETARKFDDIVDFAGLSKFIDTPVKRYSSGMYVRLAFAVAAHLEPDVLLVDEVLAVGDADFQRRCLGKMESIGESGRTVVFVSHSMPTVARLCRRAILLDQGRVVADGSTPQVIGTYLRGGHGASSERVWADGEAPGGDVARLRSLRVVDAERRTVETVDVRDTVGIELVFDLGRADVPVVPWLTVYSDQGAHLFSTMDIDPAWHVPRPPGRYQTVAWLAPNILNEGTVIVSPSVLTFQPGGQATRHAHVDDAVAFHVIDPGEGDTARGNYAGQWPGPVRPLLKWQTTYTA